MMNKKKTGFTLLELLIVIAIIAILSVILILVINPAETLKKSRDVQRMSDLNTLKTALGLILTSSSTPYLSGGNTKCLSGGATGYVMYSYAGAGAGVGAATPDQGTDANGTFANGTARATSVAAASYTNVDGTGWLPVAFSWLPGGTPISSLPIDPVNTISTLASATGTDLVYRYGCQSTGGTKPSNVFELDATLESSAYTSDDDKRAKDGGDSPYYYEVGTDIKLLPLSGI
jgi:prepilin-type N-terminal cleavage/methylation domain-containing protein